MNTNELFWSVYYDKDEETKKYRKTLEKLCEKDFMEKGKAEGLTLGRAEGINLGRAEGLTLGRAEGINLGKSEQQRDMVISLNEQHISLDVIAKAAKISINKVKQIINDYLKNNK